MNYQEREEVAGMSGLTYLRMRVYHCHRDGESGYDWRNSIGGFTVIELLIVVVILAVAALTAIPMMSSASSMQIRSATNLMMADLEYAKSMAITRGQYYFVRFDVDADSYQIEDQNGTIQHPVKKGFLYIVSFPIDSRLNRVDVTSADFNTTQCVRFDSLGSPEYGGTVSIQAGTTTATITVEPVTGYISSQ